MDKSIQRKRFEGLLFKVKNWCSCECECFDRPGTVKKPKRRKWFGRCLWKMHKIQQIQCDNWPQFPVQRKRLPILVHPHGNDFKKFDKFVFIGIHIWYIIVNSFTYALFASNWVMPLTINQKIENKTFNF